MLIGETFSPFAPHNSVFRTEELPTVDQKHPPIELEKFSSHRLTYPVFNNKTFNRWNKTTTTQAGDYNCAINGLSYLYRPTVVFVSSLIGDYERKKAHTGGPRRNLTADTFEHVHSSR